MNLYPLKFVPRFVPKMWAGRKLEQFFSKPLPTDVPYGESWELFDFPPGATGPDALQPNDKPEGWISATVANGALAGQSLHELVLADSSKLLGECEAVATPHGTQFPLLIKLLDAQDDLSVQVHPPPGYVAAHADAHLKNEAWFVLHHEAGARLLLGAKPGVTRTTFEQSLAAGTADQLMNSVLVLDHETYYMPSGTLHALGGGILAYEVQTPSDTTYRVFDFNRVDRATGKPRKLHVQQALECIQFDWDALANRTGRRSGHAVLAQAPQWILAQVQTSQSTLYLFEHTNGPIVMTAVEGSGTVSSFDHEEHYTAGETILLPPCASTQIRASQPGTLLLAAVPPVHQGQLVPRRELRLD